MEFSCEPVLHEVFCKLKQFLINATALVFPDFARVKKMIPLGCGLVLF